MARKNQSSSYGISNIVAEVLLTLLALVVLVGFLQLVNSPLNTIANDASNLVLFDYVSINKTTLLVIFDKDLLVNSTYPPNTIVLMFKNNRWVETPRIEAGELVLIKVNSNGIFNKIILNTDNGVVVLENLGNSR